MSKVSRNLSPNSTADVSRFPFLSACCNRFSQPLGIEWPTTSQPPIKRISERKEGVPDAMHRGIDSQSSLAWCVAQPCRDGTAGFVAGKASVPT